jgi:glycosyltransferase involved in cell wall biosynthesis
MNLYYKIKDFYDTYSYFNLCEYKKLNKKILYLNNNEIIDFHNNEGYIGNLLLSIKDFYRLYPDFDLEFYKRYNKDLKFEDDIDYYIHYNHYKGEIYSFKSFLLKYNIDIDFLKLFYNDLNNISKNELINILINNETRNNYILCDKMFIEKYPDFSVNIYKIFNNLSINNENNDIKYKSYWYHNKNIINQITSKNELFNNITFKNLYNFNIDLYKFLYNIKDDLNDNDIIYWYKNKDNLIYSIETFITNITDFKYELFIKNYSILKKYSNNQLIEFYINNIKKINYIYSEKIFYIKYPLFNIEDYKKIHNINFSTNLSIYNEYNLIENKDNIVISIDDFYNKNKNFNINIYKYYLNSNNIYFSNDNDYIYYLIKINDIDKYYTLNQNYNNNIYIHFNVPYIDLAYLKYKDFDKDFYKLIYNLNNYNDEEVILHYKNIGIELKYASNISEINEENIGFNLNIYKSLNIDLKNMNSSELFYHWFNKGKYEDRIYSVKSFIMKYPELEHKFELNELNIINWMNNEIRKKNIENDYIGRKVINDIYEVLIDLKNPFPKNLLKHGISLIIRAKNEELNLKDCIESVVDLVDEIIFVDNNSTDSTYQIMKEYCNKYENIRLYQYNLNVSKVGIEHSNAIKNKNPNTLGTFYNWCLSKATRYNVFKWDADFLCIRNNFNNLVNLYNLRNRNDKFAIWFTGITLFENNNLYYINHNSYYNEYRIFSFKNNFCWYDGDICEYTDPYLNSCKSDKKYIYKYPLFYELKRTSINEFKERSSMIDIRDINDEKILNKLKDNNANNLIKINSNNIYFSKNIIIYTPSLSFGGGNQFIINIYKIYKKIGFNVIIIPLKNDNLGINKYNVILENDIYNYSEFNIKFIENFSPDYIIFNSDIPFNENMLTSINKLTNIIFVSHSDVAYSNYFIEKYHILFYKIITVNNYTINKLSTKLNIDINKFIKLVNYTKIKKNNNDTLLNNNLKIKNYKFGVISRFSEDKNIPMLLLSLINIFKIYPKYKCYLVGTHNKYYDEYLKQLCKKNNIEEFICFEGYQSDVTKYYEMFDFIILPSVSEGCSYNIIEAMSIGLPVIVSNVGGNHELVENEINGFIYNYSEIRTYENNTLYITNYNNHLDKIGYIINNNENKKLYKLHNEEYNNLDVYIPYYVNCYIHNNIKNVNKINNCTICNNIKNKCTLFKKNMDEIYNNIIKMIECNDNQLKSMYINNINFINNNYNKYIYFNQLLEIINK